jgi:hypothetical protein
MIKDNFKNKNNIFKIKYKKFLDMYSLRTRLRTCVHTYAQYVFCMYNYIQRLHACYVCIYIYIIICYNEFRNNVFIFIYQYYLCIY